VPASQLAIVVVTWESAGPLRRLVDSMNRHLSGEEELVVVDNASGDDPETVAREWRGALRFERLPENAGFGAASNRGVRLTEREQMVLLNPDTVLLDASLVALADRAVEAGALAGPRLLEPDRSVQPSASGPPVGVWPWLGALVPGAVAPPALLRRTEPWRLERTVPVSWLTGACIAGARDLLLDLGPFDPAIELYGEDLDLGLRAAAAGVPSLYCPDVSRIVHEGGASAALRFPAGPQMQMAATRRTVVRRAFGPRRERLGWLAQRLNLRLRLIAKTALGRPASRERLALRAAAAARPVSLPARDLR
jgi:N-acetylglucosaminyl-diphospho-decaprenol L-rhamnosyltransferase